MDYEDSRWQTSLQQLGKAIERLEDVLKESPENPLWVDATIQRFEFTIELFWKTFRHLLALEGKEAFSPKECLQSAYQLGWIHDEATWLKLLKSRNLTSHTYNEPVAREVIATIQVTFPEMKNTYLFLKNRFAKPA